MCKVSQNKNSRFSVHLHGNNKRLPSSTCLAETIENVVKFICNVAEDQALLLPGRVPGFKRIDVKLLASTLTKHSLWKTYHDICNGERACARPPEVDVLCEEG